MQQETPPIVSTNTVSHVKLAWLVGIGIDGVGTKLIFVFLARGPQYMHMVSIKYC